MDNNMEPVQIPQSDLINFKEKVKRWLMLDIQISEMESKLRDLKKIRNKEIEPQLTDFMVQYNITDLNTESGKLKCSARNSKKPLNKENIKNNLSKVITDIGLVEKAMEQLDNREMTTTYKLTKIKNK
jgi:hypothetical protein|tara:strand:+ start:587 stop:970 length:384 start_codon:yes stop_codon:yes gene_type:complete